MLSQWTQLTGHRRGIFSSSKTNILICFKRKIQFYAQSELQLFTTKLRVERCFKQKETTLSSIQKQAPNFTKLPFRHNRISEGINHSVDDCTSLIEGSILVQ